MNRQDKYIKRKEQLTPEYLKKLGEWIKENPTKFFSKDNEADSWHDFVFWPTKKTDRDHLVLVGEVCVIDRMWEGRHAYVVCQITKKSCKDLYLVVYVDDLKRSDWRNGYFLIPELLAQ